jgi:hypothetical protein
MEQIKAMHFGSGQGANHSDTGWYREDLQRGHDPKGTVLCSIKSKTLHWGGGDAKSCRDQRPKTLISINTTDKGLHNIHRSKYNKFTI